MKSKTEYFIKKTLLNCKFYLHFSVHLRAYELLQKVWLFFFSFVNP